MALKTLGTTGTTVLNALVFNTNQTVADIASIANNIKNDKVNGTPIWPGGFANNGLLYIPNRGVLQVLPGDYVAYDAFGWPILVAAASIAAGGTSWAHS